MRAYISISFVKKSLLGNELNSIASTLACFNISPFVFVDQYQFDATQQRQMMQQAMNDIDSCDLLIAETSDKAIGIGIEVGYAKAKGKPIIYLRKQTAEHSTTVSGISDFQIVYASTEDLQKQLARVLTKIKESC